MISNYKIVINFLVEYVYYLIYYLSLTDFLIWFNITSLVVYIRSSLYVYIIVQYLNIHVFETGIFFTLPEYCLYE